jgi:membrane protein implicated in regulation of membrane protease activity
MTGLILLADEAAHNGLSVAWEIAGAGGPWWIAFLAVLVLSEAMFAVAFVAAIIRCLRRVWRRWNERRQANRRKGRGP